jgi:hypothetical protein
MLTTRLFSYNENCNKYIQLKSKSIVLVTSTRSIWA